MNVSEIELKVDGQKVHGRFYLPAGSPNKPAVLFLHGWTGRPNDNAAQVLVAQGYPCFTLIFRGHLGSDGDIKLVTAQNGLDDATAAYDFIKQQLGDDVQIAAVGNSYGAYIAALLSGERGLAALSLRVPAAYPDDTLAQAKWGKGHDDKEIAGWRLQPVSFAESQALRLVHDFKGPVQIIEGEKDEIIPHQTVQNYIEAVAEPAHLEYHLMKGWPHSLGDHVARNEEFQKILLEWVKSL